jgi:uncharacterized cofD-like protein
MEEKKQKIVTIGGGSGHFVLLSGLRDLPGIDITAIVSMIDSGGSSGRLRDEFGILPPGDILKCIIALSPHRQVAQEILLKRFQGISKLNGHNAGNLLMTMLSRYTSFTQAVSALSEILEVKGNILPVSIDKATLVAQLSDGNRIYGEYAIGTGKNRIGKKISQLSMVPHQNDAVTAYEPVIEAIKEAHYIILAPGDLYSSIISNLIVPGIKEALQQTNASLIYVLNIMTRPGETHNFQANDFVRELEYYIGKPINQILFNNQKPPDDILEKYLIQPSQFVYMDVANEQWKNYSVHASDLLQVTKGIVRHDAAKLARLIQHIINS